MIIPGGGGKVVMKRDTAVIAGSSGLVGSHCLEGLLEGGAYERMVALTRRPLDRRHPRLVESVVDFEKLEELNPFPAGDVFCALGTTIRRAGSQAAFSRVDLDYPRIIAERSAAAGARQFLLVSSVGADAASRNFYLRVKGELERAVMALGFEAVHIFRPSFLFGERAERRPGEAAGIPIARALQFALMGGLRKYRPIEAKTVAAAMVAAATEGRPGRHVYHYDEMIALAGRV
jgi:uncharacterized protein YbjT (DUF2867 family)